VNIEDLVLVDPSAWPPRTCPGPAALMPGCLCLSACTSARDPVPFHNSPELVSSSARPLCTYPGPAELMSGCSHLLACLGTRDPIPSPCPLELIGLSARPLRMSERLWVWPQALVR